MPSSTHPLKETRTATVTCLLFFNPLERTFMLPKNRDAEAMKQQKIGKSQAIPKERSMDEMKKNRGLFWSYEIISYFCTAIRDEMSRLAQKEVWVSG